jgi:hypothetical protein
MADFLTRLAERTLGMAPVVQPLITSVFAPEPANHLPGLEYEGEAPASSGDLYRAKSPPAVEMPPARDTLKEVSQDLAISERGEHGTNPRITSPDPSGTSDVSPEPYHPARPSTSERSITSARDDQSSIALTVPKPPRRVPDAVEPDLSDANTVSGREDQRNLASAVPGALPRMPESRPGSSHPGDSDSSDYKLMTGKEDQRHPSRATARHPQTPPEDATMTQEQEQRSNVVPTLPGRSQTIPDEPELLHPAGSGPTRRGVNTGSPRPVWSENIPLGPPLAENESGTRHRSEAGPTPSVWDAPAERPEDATMTQEQEQRSNVVPTMPGRSQTIPDEPEIPEKPELVHPVRTLLDPVQGATLPPRPSLGTQGSLDANEGTIESKVIPDRPAAPDAAPVAPRMVRPRLKPHVERGPQEPRVDAPESSAPTVRVAIGRIEVRAITPPPSPFPQQAAPARPAPTLSLDDYLKQRNREQR